MRDFWLLWLTKLHRWSGRRLQREKVRRFLSGLARVRNAHWN